MEFMIFTKTKEEAVESKAEEHKEKSDNIL